jgi:hypothetical protein
MKPIRITILFFLISTSLFSQTKKETEDWVKSKFNKWKITDTRTEYKVDGVVVDNPHSEKPLSLTIIGCNLTLKTQYYNYLVLAPTYKTYSLNIGNIEEVKWVKFNDTDYLVINVKKSTVKLTSVYKEDKDIMYVDGCIISFKTDGEEDFEARMLKAFNHLRSFCPNPKIVKKKEVF